MARISNYNTDSTLNPEDKWIGTDGAEGAENGKTKNFTVQGLADYMAQEGVAGPQGLPGIPGNDGLDGADGANGTDGTNGVDGAVGATGPQGLQGIQGPAGPQGDLGPVGPAGLEWQGLWDTDTAYAEDDAVGYDGASWFCILAVTGTGNDTPDVDTTHWALLAAQGAQGPAGATGAQGPAGGGGSEITLTTTGTSGAATYNSVSGILNIPNYAVSGGTITLTTSGTSGAATLIGNTLNIPQYSGGSGIPWLESNATDLTVWNNGKSNLSGNTSFGEQALKSNNALGLYNTAYGFQALALNQGGSQNVAVGMQALVNVNGGYFNTGIGTGAARNTQTGSSNTAIGNNALNQNTGSNGNTAIGYAAGYYGQGANNVYIGFNSGPSALSAENNKLYISNTPGTPLIGGDFLSKVVTIDGILVTSKFRVSSLAPAPATSSDGGDTGEIRYSSDFIYVCVAPNTWKRSALLSW